MPKLHANNLVWFSLSALVVVLDQFTKHLVLTNLIEGIPYPVFPFLNWMLVTNTGAAFSFLQGAGGWQTYFLTVFSLVVSIGLSFYLLSLDHGERIRLGWPLSLIIGGAIGNVWDRIQLGAVVDFIYLHAGAWYWPAFNLADSAITVGAMGLVWHFLFFKDE